MKTVRIRAKLSPSGQTGKLLMSDLSQPPAAGREQEAATALRHLKQGGVVALPTDTLYGLAADVFNAAALRRVFDIKGRPAELALPVLVSDVEQAERVARDFPPAARRLAQAFWPGSLTLVLPKTPDLSPLITGGRDTVAVRMPQHWAPLALAAGLGRPITGTSANRSGAPDLPTLAALQATLGDAVDYIIAQGPPPQGAPSTIIDLTGDRPTLIREGVLPFAAALQVCNAGLNQT